MLTNYIAHACGGIDGTTYTNSLEALEQSYRLKYKYIEIDISETHDGKFVLIHDWQETQKKLFGKTGITSEKELLSSKMIKGFTPLNLDMSLKWLAEHHDVFFISDTKNVSSIKIFQYVAKYYPELINRFIPQIYSFAEYDKALELGYQNIVLTLYRLQDSDNEIINFISTHKLLAVSMGKEKADQRFAFKIKKLGVKTIAFTINEMQEQKTYEKLGIDVFFTDFLY